jgi:hypothetical protein
LDAVHAQCKKDSLLHSSCKIKLEKQLLEKCPKLESVPSEEEINTNAESNQVMVIDDASSAQTSDVPEK